MKQNHTKSKSENTQTDTHGTKYMGVDVSSEYLDVYFKGKYTRLFNNSEGINEIREMTRREKSPVIVAYESTGWLSGILSQQLLVSGIKQICLNPARVRNYARAIGSGAKTDKIDCEMIARFAEEKEARCNVIENPAIMKLKELQTLLNFIKRRRAQARVSLAAKRDQFIIRQLQSAIEQDEKRIDEIENEMQRLLNEQKELRERYEFYLSLAGIGPCNAMGLLIYMPELGTLNRRQAASLVGVAPYNWDSGKMKGKRIPRFGRKNIRSLLFQAVISSLHLKESPIKDKYYQLIDKERKEGAGKRASRVAVIACVRKIINWLNSKTREWLEEKEKNKTEEQKITKAVSA